MSVTLFLFFGGGIWRFYHVLNLPTWKQKHQEYEQTNKRINPGGSSHVGTVLGGRWRESVFP